MLQAVLPAHMMGFVPLQVGMLTHQPPELLREGRMSPAVDVYRWAVFLISVGTVC
jgi:hypothetical protein